MAKYAIVLVVMLLVYAQIEGQNLNRLKKKMANLKKALARPITRLAFKNQLARRFGLSIKDLNFKEVREFFRKTPDKSFQNESQRMVISRNFLSTICSLCRRTRNIRCMRIYCFRGRN